MSLFEHFWLLQTWCELLVKVVVLLGNNVHAIEQKITLY